METNTIVRESYLTNLGNALLKSRQMSGVDHLPDATKLRVSCGFTSTGLRKRRDGTVGGKLIEAHHPRLSKDKLVEIFVSPTLVDPRDIARLMMRELCRIGIVSKQKDRDQTTFDKGKRKSYLLALDACGFDVSLVKAADKAKRVHIDALPLRKEQIALVDEIIESIGGHDGYMHASLTLRDRFKNSPEPAKGHRVMLVRCPHTERKDGKDVQCEYKFRTSNAVIEMGLPTCPVHGVKMVKVVEKATAKAGKGKARNVGNRFSKQKPANDTTAQPAA